MSSTGKNKFKILFYVGGYSVFGSEWKMLSIMQGLMQKGHQVYCITNGWSDGKFNELLAKNNISFKSTKLGYIYLTKPLWTIDTLVNYPKAIFQHWRILRSFKPDIDYFNAYKTILMLNIFLGKKSIFHVGDILPVNNKNKVVFKILNIFVNKYIASSQYIKKNLIDLGINPGKIEVVLNGVNLNVKIELKQRSDKHIGIIGQVIPRKGHKDLIGALNLIKTRYEFKKFKLYIYGTGQPDFIEELKKMISLFEMKDQIHWMGYIEDKNEIYNNLDLVVVPSHTEAFGFSAAEPGFYGIPVIASNTGGLREIINNNENGLLFTSKDSNQLAKLIYKFLNGSSNDLSLLRIKAYNKKMFSVNKMTDRIEEIVYNEGGI